MELKSTAPKGGVFFTSIPKAGKNLVYSFLNQLGVTRIPLAREGALSITECPILIRTGRKCTYASPAIRAAEDHQDLNRFVSAIGQAPPHSILHHHFPFHPQLAELLLAREIPVLFLCRDPRDILISMADYILAQKKPPHLHARLEALDRSSLVARLWSGDDELIGFRDYLSGFLPWRNLPEIVVLRFEDLIGPAGGGDANRQFQALSRIAACFPETPSAVFADAQARTFNRNAGTFFRGKSGRWRDESDPAVVDLLQGAEMTSVVAEWS